MDIHPLTNHFIVKKDVNTLCVVDINNLENPIFDINY